MSGLTTGKRRRLTRDLEQLRLNRVEVEARIDYAKKQGKVSDEEIARAANVVGAIARIEKELGIPKGATVEDLGRVIDSYAPEGLKPGYGTHLATHLKRLGWTSLS